MGGKGNESLLEIGGYFGLAMPDHGDQFPGAIKFQSARAAIRAVLEGVAAKLVLLPDYICNSVIKAAADSGAEVKTYRLDNRLYPKDLPSALGEGCFLLYVNYFGLCQENIHRLLKHFPSAKLIVDNSQALFSPPTDALATIYSVRKFVGVPDGGLLISRSLEFEYPEKEDTVSIDRTRHLFLRMAYSGHEGYSSYIESENSLNDTTPLRMSRLTRRLLASVDMTVVKRQRRANFLVLAEKLKELNSWHWSLDSDAVPLCYPLVVDWDVDDLKKRLAKKNIYIPNYWREAKPRISPNTIEYRFTQCCLAVPCDQRYTSNQISYLADMIISYVNAQKINGVL